MNSAPDPHDSLHAVTTALRDFGESADRMVDLAGRAVGLYRTDLRALSILMRRASAGLETSASDLGGHLRLTKPATTAVVDRLVESGHATRARSQQDRRRVLVHHTDSAVRDGMAAFAPMGGALRAALADFTDEELRTALQVIRTATASLTELESTLPAQDSAAEPREDAREAS
ncbi:MarR family winged helix-turn-helix transcriptional regulator [Micrococcus lylae]|uniref:MarR family winged helix-turn-helix transcriptional regulator n=1 Tax=Micrococcus lylae TaxID=1273 RepID=UPI000A8090DD|nr:MarR family transcriptional regulator [Micrococcus lylae]